MAIPALAGAEKNSIFQGILAEGVFILANNPDFSRAMGEDDPRAAPCWFKSSCPDITTVVGLSVVLNKLECFKAACQCLGAEPLDAEGLDPLGACVEHGWLEGAQWVLLSCNDPRESRGSWGSPWENAAGDVPMRKIMSASVRALDERDEISAMALPATPRAAKGL